MKPNHNELDTLLESIEGIEPATPPSELWSRIETQLAHETVSPPKRWYYVAAAALLLALNIYAATTYTSEYSEQSDYTDAVLLNYEY